MFISFFENIESERHMLAFFTLKESNKKKKKLQIERLPDMPAAAIRSWPHSFTQMRVNGSGYLGK